MEALDRIFGPWTQDLAPGLGDKAGVVRDRILYRAAEEKSLPDVSRLVGDDMNVDLGALHMPLTDPVKEASAMAIEPVRSQLNAAARSEGLTLQPPSALTAREIGRLPTEAQRAGQRSASSPEGKMNLEREQK